MDSDQIEIDRYPGLRRLAWQLHRRTISEAEAFALYEREWRHLDLDRLDPEERQLIECLTRKYGHGVLNV